mgnify:CR=1 FL=1
MTQTGAVVNKLNTKLSKLEKEVYALRSFLISVVGEDEEGEYHPRFVKEILKAAREKPDHSFKSKNSFLAALRGL